MDDRVMEINRIWSMPSKNTFQIPPINALIKRYIDPYNKDSIIIDPFSNNSVFKETCITNDLDPDMETDFHLDSLEFMKLFKDDSVDMVLYDPPYSPRQVSEIYKKMSISVNMQTTQASYWTNQKKQISRIVKPDGIVISCGWNSGGIGITNGFQIVEILLVPHGGHHNDTIVTVEKKDKK